MAAGRSVVVAVVVRVIYVCRPRRRAEKVPLPDVVDGGLHPMLLGAALPPTPPSARPRPASAPRHHRHRRRVVAAPAALRSTRGVCATVDCSAPSPCRLATPRHRARHGASRPRGNAQVACHGRPPRPSSHLDDVNPAGRAVGGGHGAAAAACPSASRASASRASACAGCRASAACPTAATIARCDARRRLARWDEGGGLTPYRASAARPARGRGVGVRVGIGVRAAALAAPVVAVAVRLVSVSSALPAPPPPLAALALPRRHALRRRAPAQLRAARVRRVERLPCRQLLRLRGVGGE